MSGNLASDMVELLLCVENAHSYYVIASSVRQHKKTWLPEVDLPSAWMRTQGHHAVLPHSPTLPYSTQHKSEDAVDCGAATLQGVIIDSCCQPVKLCVCTQVLVYGMQCKDMQPACI